MGEILLFLHPQFRQKIFQRAELKILVFGNFRICLAFFDIFSERFQKHGELIFDFCLVEFYVIELVFVDCRIVAVLEPVIRNNRHGFFKVQARILFLVGHIAVFFGFVHRFAKTTIC